MYYIYCCTNKINGKTYVGQTNNIANRKSQHRSVAFNPSSQEYNSLFHRKLREYGEDNFDFEILEEIDDNHEHIVDAREIYWIDVKKSFVKDNGYNLTLGGQSEGSKTCQRRQDCLKAIYLLQNTNLKQKEISQKLGLAESTIVDLNHGRLYPQPDISYPIRTYGISTEKKEATAYLLANSRLTQREIAAATGVSRSAVQRINSGEIRVAGYDNYPLRKPVSTIKG